MNRNYWIILCITAFIVVASVVYVSSLEINTPRSPSSSTTLPEATSLSTATLAQTEKITTPPSQTSTSETVSTEMVATVSGYVIRGGDTTQQGLAGAPRVFVYSIAKDDGNVTDVTYTAYPPSPFGDKQMRKIRLTFHAGTIKVGDYLKARGRYKQDNTVTVAEEGDYIETYPTKP